MDKIEKQRLKALAKELVSLSPDEIESRIESFDSDALIELLNSRSNKVADAAYYCLGRHPDGESAVINAILQNCLTRRDSKVRGTNFLECRGRSHPEAVEAYFHLLDDKNEEVAHNALFGVVFWQDPAHLTRLRQKYDSLESEGILHRALGDAIEAIERGNPFLFSRYHDPDAAEKLWGIENPWQKRKAAMKAFQRRT